MGMTNQEAFDKAVPKIIKQGRRSISGNTCKFRSENGDRCAVGMMFPKSQYKPYFDDSGSILLIMEEVPALKGTTMKFLRAMQHAHDNADDGFNKIDCNRKQFRKEFAKAARKVARRFKLKVGALDKAMGK